jgi:hypothetical protein
VDHDVRLPLVDDLDPLGRTDVARDDVRLGQPAVRGVGQVLQPTGGEVVEHPHLTAHQHQSGDHVTADEAGASRDQDAPGRQVGRRRDADGGNWLVHVGTPWNDGLSARFGNQDGRPDPNAGNRHERDFWLKIWSRMGS